MVGASRAMPPVKMPANAKRTTAVVSHIIPSTSHEFAAVSWFAAHVSKAEAREMVQEEANHQVVWGLARCAPPVDVSVASVGKVQVHVRTIVGHQVVGLMNAPAILVELVIVDVSAKSTSMSASDSVVTMLMTEARRAYDAHFQLQGLNIFYTRKHYEDVEWKFYGVLPPRGVATIFLDAGLEMDILSDARRFLADEATYNRFGRPFKRVYCLHGPPGTGKSSIVTAIASELHRPLAIFNTDSLRDDTFLELLTSCPKNAVFLFEDVDALFRKRDTAIVSDVGGMTFSTMLNALDGVLHPRGAIVFLTTNHLDQLDAAVRRPGRVDRLIQIGYATPSASSAMWRATFPDHPVPPVLLTANSKVVPAHLSEILFAHRDDRDGTAAAVAVDLAMAGTRLKSSSSSASRVAMRSTSS